MSKKRAVSALQYIAEQNAIFGLDIFSDQNLGLYYAKLGQS